MYVWILTVSYLYSSLTGNVSTLAAFETKGECEQAAAKVRVYESRTAVECRAVKYANKDNQP